MNRPAATYDVIVIGGGAAGMMAAGRAGSRGRRVLLLEKNARLGEKLAISGGGRCNILNAEEDERALLAKYGKAEQFLYSPFSRFGMRDAWAFFEERGLPLKVERLGRAFPESEKAADVIRLLRSYLSEGKATVRLRTPVDRVERRGGRIEGVRAGGLLYAAESYVLATGGLSRPETGSTGDGFGWLKALGHAVAEPTPTIVPLRAKEKWVKEVAGVALPRMKVTFAGQGKRKVVREGPLLFTHTGISGPAVLNAAGEVAELLYDGEVTARIDLFPGTDSAALDRQLQEHLKAHSNKEMRNALKAFAPAGLSDLLLSLVPSLDPAFKAHSVSKEERRALASLMKALPLTITGLMGFDVAVVADGGVPLSEIDMRTMRSKKAENLFVTGDLLHITRPSGGYSLQLCWTTGFVAGEHA